MPHPCACPATEYLFFKPMLYLKWKLPDVFQQLKPIANSKSYFQSALKNNKCRTNTRATENWFTRPSTWRAMERSYSGGILNLWKGGWRDRVKSCHVRAKQSFITAVIWHTYTFTTIQTDDRESVYVRKTLQAKQAYVTVLSYVLLIDYDIMDVPM